MSARGEIYADRLALRWTVGNVRERGFEMLRLSIACAFRLFGASAHYVVCVNSVPEKEARARMGDLPVDVQWRTVTHKNLPDVLREHFDETLIEGMGWKLVPLRICPDRHELALDNDCIIWDMPQEMRQWLESDDACLFAEDVERCLGSFEGVCPPGKFNGGIRGLPPGADLGQELVGAIQDAGKTSGKPLRLISEIEEQGLQAAAMCRMKNLLLVRTEDVSICSPFWPRSPEAGRCGAHFVGLNAHHIPWNYYDRPADVWLDEHWARHRPELYRRAGLERNAQSGAA